MKSETKVVSQSKNPKRFKKIVLIVCIPLVLVLILTFKLWYPLPLPWGFVRADSIPVVSVAVTIKDDQTEWHPEENNEVLGAGTHWLGHTWMNAPAGKPGGLWYDGKLIVTETEHNFLNGYEISSNGEHYAYQRETLNINNDDATTVAELVVDSKVVNEGVGMHLYEISNNGDVYYSCSTCKGNTDGFYRNNKKVSNFSGLPAGVIGDPEDRQKFQCLFRPDADVKNLLHTLNSNSSDGVSLSACSPNGKYIVKDIPETLWPEGSKDVLYINDSKIDEGRLTDFVINDEGQISYLSRGVYGLGLASLTINGRGHYLLPGSTGIDAKLLYSPSFKHIAIVQGDKWWIDGRPTEVDQYESVSLSDTTFYVYRR